MSQRDKPRLALNNNTTGVRERSEWSGGPSDIEGKTTRVEASKCGQRTSFNRTRVAGHLDEIQGVVANTLNSFRAGAVGLIISLLNCASRRDAEGVDNNIFLAICESKDGFIARCGAVGQHNRIRKIGGHTEGRNRPILDEDHHSLMRRGVDDEEVLVLKGAIEFQLTALITRDRCLDCHNGDNEEESRNHL